MILAKEISILKKDGIKLVFTNVTQMYTVANFITITASDHTGLVTDRFKLSELQVMTVRFGD